MRKHNPARTNPCNCEHIHHFTDKAMIAFDGHVIREAHTRTKHRYMKVAAGDAWAWAVGYVCKDCAETCMKDYILANHVCDTDCEYVMDEGHVRDYPITD